MPKISTYTPVTPTDSDLILITDASDSNNTKNVTVSSLKEALFAYIEIHDATAGEDTTATTTPAKLTAITTQGAISANSGLQQNGQGRVTNGGPSRTFMITYSVSISAQNNNECDMVLECQRCVTLIAILIFFLILDDLVIF